VKKHLPGIVGFGLLVVLGLSALYWHSVLTRGLPPRTEHATAGEAWEAAAAWQAAHGGEIRAVAGTGSMAPYIPPAAPGLDPRRTIVAYIVTDPAARFADIRPGQLIIYRAEWQPAGAPSVVHGAAKLTGTGWIMSGLGNREFETHWRVTPANYLGRVAATFVINPKTHD
jgi:hypothetical protein